MLERHFVERDRQLHVGHPAQDSGEHDLHFGTGQLLPDTLVPTVAESQLLAGITGQVELVGIGVGGGIPVRRGQIDDDAIAGLDGLAPDLDVLECHSALAGLNDRQEAHQLFDRVCDELRVVGITQQRSLFGVLQQRQQADADHVRGGFVAGDQQAGAQLRGFFDADLARGDPFGQVGHGVLGRLFLFLLHQVDQVLVQAHRALLHGVGGRVAGHPRVRVFLEELVVLIGHPEHVADHPRRHRQGELADHVDG